MNYYRFNWQDILQKAKEKAAEYCKQNKEAIKEKSKERYQNLSQEEKDKITEYQRKKYALKINNFLCFVVFFLSIIMSEKRQQY